MVSIIRKLSEICPSAVPNEVQNGPSCLLVYPDFIGAFRLSLACVSPFPPFVISRSGVRISAPAFSLALVKQGFSAASLFLSRRQQVASVSNM